MKTLRPYQKDVHQKLDEHLATGKKKGLLIALPTGSGKTFTMASWLAQKLQREWKKVLWLVHTRELGAQAAEAFGELGVGVTHWHADSKDSGGPVVVASVLSCKTLADSFDCIVVDEVHRAAANTFKWVVDNVPHEYSIGLSATPRRPDGKKTGFDTRVAALHLTDLVDLGFLARPKYVKIRSGEYHRLMHSGQDYTGASLEGLNTGTRNDKIAQYLNKHHKDEKALVFAVSVTHAQSLAETIQTVTGQATAWIAGITPPKERDEAIQAFHRGQIQRLVSVQILVQGFDAPDVGLIVMARPTASHIVFLQTAGRGSRRTEAKSTFTILNFVDDGNTYSDIAELWAYQYLGHNPDGSTPQERKAIVEKAMADCGGIPRLTDITGIPGYVRRLGPDSRISWVYRNWVGVCRLRSQFGDSPVQEKSRGLTASMWMALSRLSWLLVIWKRQEYRLLGQVVPRRDFVMLSWRLCAAEEDFDFPKWKNICWGLIKSSEGKLTSDNLKFYELALFSGRAGDPTLRVDFDKDYWQAAELLKQMEEQYNTPEYLQEVHRGLLAMPAWMTNGMEFSPPVYQYGFFLSRTNPAPRTAHISLWSALQRLSEDICPDIPIRLVQEL